MATNPYEPPRRDPSPHGGHSHASLLALGIRLLFVVAVSAPFLVTSVPFLFCAGIPLFDPLGGASGNLAEPPTPAERLERALPFLAIAAVAIGLAIIAGWWAWSRSGQRQNDRH